MERPSCFLWEHSQLRVALWQEGRSGVSGQRPAPPRGGLQGGACRSCTAPRALVKGSLARLAQVTGHAVSKGAAILPPRPKQGGRPGTSNPGKREDKPSGRPALPGAPCLLQGLRVTHKLNAHSPSLPLFFPRPHFSHVYLLVSVRIQLVFLSLKETGKHTLGMRREQRSPTAFPSLGSGQQLPLTEASSHSRGKLSKWHETFFSHFFLL